jgi:hypothetical protein
VNRYPFPLKWGPHYVKVGREWSGKETTNNEASIEFKNNEPSVKLFIR